MREFFKSHFNKIRDINQKYSNPRAKMNKKVTLALLILRIYLIIMVCILVFKFITVIRG